MLLWRRTVPDTTAAKAFVLRSGCALLPHPSSSGHVILHGGRSTADVQPGTATTPASRENCVLSDWHLLSLSAPSATSAPLEVHAAPLHTTPDVAQACLQTCKHCLLPATAAPSGSRLDVAVFGGSRGLTTPHPCSVVTIDVESRRITLAHSARAATLQTLCPSPAQAMCCGAADVRSGRGAAYLLPGSSNAEMSLGVMAVTSSGVSHAWSSSLPLPPQPGAKPTWTALCAAGEAGGRGGVIVLAQCTVSGDLVGVYAWLQGAPAGSGTPTRDTRAVLPAGGGPRPQRTLLLSPVDAAAKVEQARKEAEARCAVCAYTPPPPRRRSQKHHTVYVITEVLRFLVAWLWGVH